MDHLRPIRSPARRKWREFRAQVLPVVVFICTVAAIVYLWGEVTPRTVGPKAPVLAAEQPEASDTMVTGQIPLTAPFQAGPVASVAARAH